MKTATHTPIIPFEPRTQHEEVTAAVVRMMLKYELIRVQLESNLIDLDFHQRAARHHEAVQLRLTGFRTQREAREQGMPFTYDDDLICRGAIRMAYLLVRKETEEARRVEEQVVTISVDKALYRMDEEPVTFATAA